MTRTIASAFGRIFDHSARDEPVHFHSGGRGHPIVCHDRFCSSPRLDPRDARAVALRDVGDLR